MAILTYNGHPIDCGSYIQPFSVLPNDWSVISNGENVWIDLDGVAHYSAYTTNKYLNGSTWDDMTISGGFPPQNGKYVWTVGPNYYYSGGKDNSNQITFTVSLNGRRLDTSRKTWINRPTYLFGDDIWTDGTNIYHTYAGSSHVLDVSTSTWSEKTWNGFTPMSGLSIWYDGEHYYYSAASYQYVLDVSTSTWLPKTWYGLTSFNGNDVWTLGNNVYYSPLSTHYILNKATSTWSRIYPGVSFYGHNVWHHAGNTYADGKYIIVDNNPSQYNFISYETT